MNRRLLVLALALTWALGRPVSATVYVAADLSELVADAGAVVHGHVTAAEARWLEGRRGIETVVTLVVSESFKGALDGEVSVRVPGGQMGPYRSILVGAPALREGDEVILFLGVRGPAIPHIVGLSQGVFRVVTDRESGRKVVIPELSRLTGDGLSPVRLVRGDPSRRPTPLPAFAARVRELATQGDR